MQTLPRLLVVAALLLPLGLGAVRGPVVVSSPRGFAPPGWGFAEGEEGIACPSSDFDTCSIEVLDLYNARIQWDITNSLPEPHLFIDLPVTFGADITDVELCLSGDYPIKDGTSEADVLFINNGGGNAVSFATGGCYLTWSASPENVISFYTNYWWRPPSPSTDSFDFILTITSIDGVPAVTATPTSTNTPPAGGGNCVPWDSDPVPTSIPSRTATMYGATSAPSNTPSGSNTPTVSPTPIGLIPPPTTWTFNTDMQGWTCYGACGYSPDFGRSGGSIFLGADTGYSTDSGQADLVLPQSAGANWVMSGYYFVDDTTSNTPSNVVLELTGWLYAIWGIPGHSWVGNSESRSSDIHVTFDNGAWVRFFLWPGMTHVTDGDPTDIEAFKINTVGALGIDYTWDDPFFIYLDDLRWMLDTDPTIPHCGSPTPPPIYTTPVPIAPPSCTEFTCIDPVSMGSFCIGLPSIELELIGWDTEGFGVCLEAFNIEQAYIGDFDMMPIINFGLFGSMLLALINFVTKWRS